MSMCTVGQITDHLFHILEIPGSVLSLETSYHDWGYQWCDSVYVLKGSKFNFLLCLKYPWSYKIIIFITGKNPTPLGSCICYNKKLWHCEIRTCSFQIGDMTPCSIVFILTLQSYHPSPLSKCHLVSVWVSFFEEAAAFLFSYMCHRTTTLYFPSI
jgi:hypothetical protein